MSTPTPIEYGEVLGYALAVWPKLELSQYPVSHAEVWSTPDEARTVRNDVLRRRPALDLRIVEIREVVVE